MDFCLRPDWLECLQVFDEEACRYFLYEIGKRIVPCYPFSFGIEEVYGLIVERYGLEQTADVTSILQELLENDRNACGFGDDGDIWRSWRHSWRHRNDDALKPFIPRVGNIILQPATAIHIRRLKADNFLRQQQTENDFVDGKVIHNLASCCCLEVDLPGYCRALGPVPSQPCGIDDNTHQNEALVLDRRGKRHQSLTGEEGSPSGFVFKLSLPDIEQDAQQRTLIQSDDGLRCSSPAKESCTVGYAACDGDFVNCSKSPNPRTSLEAREHGEAGYYEAKTSGVKSGCCTFGLTKRVSQETDGYNNAQPGTESVRVANRQARMIDGTVFVLRPKKSRILDSILPEPKKPTVLDHPHLSSKQDNSSIKQILDLGKGCIRHLRRALSLEKSRRISLFFTLRSHSSQVSRDQDINFLTGMLPSHRDYKDALQHEISQPSFGLDGVIEDAPNVSPCFPDLNKPLPLSPEHKPKLTASSAERVGNLPVVAIDPHTTISSSTSSQFSTRSVKIDLRDTTRQFPNPAASSSQAPSSVNRSSAIAVSPEFPNQQRLRASPLSWKTISVRASVVDNPPSLSPTPPSPLEIRRMRSTTTERPSEGLSGSQSLPFLRSTIHVNDDTNFARVAAPSGVQAPGLVDHIHHVPEVRGRSDTLQTSSPTRDEFILPRQDLIKRSRSPIKRLLAIGRAETSDEVKTIDSGVEVKTPESAAKRSLKKWGHKIKYGFLALDEEQLRQEELCERYMDGRDAPSRNATFPVSLEPPTQAKLQSEIELYVTVTANRYLMKEAKAGRLSAESVFKFQDRWKKLGRPQVLEFHYDQMYQHDLVFANLSTVKLYGDAAKDPTQVQSTLNGWRVMAREMSVRTFCSPDSVLRKHLHDAHRVLELLGAPLVTFLAYENMQIKSLQMITQRQRERMQNKRAAGHSRSLSDGSRFPSAIDLSYEAEYTADAFQLDRVRLSPTPSPKHRVAQRKATGAGGAIMSLPLPLARIQPRTYKQSINLMDSSRRGRSDKAIREKPEDLLL